MKYLRVKKRGRGNEYLTPNELKLLKNIQKHGETYTYKLNREKGYSFSTAHKLLENLEKKGFTQSRWEDGKHLYMLTSSGRELATDYQNIESFYFKTITCVHGQSIVRLINMGPADLQLVIRTNCEVAQSEFPILASATYSFNTPATIMAKSKEGDGFIVSCEKDTGQS